MLVFNAQDNLVDEVAKSRSATGQKPAETSVEVVPPLSDLPEVDATTFDLDDDALFERALRGELGTGATASAATVEKSSPADQSPAVDKAVTDEITTTASLPDGDDLLLAPNESLPEPPELSTVLDEQLQTQQSAAPLQVGKLLAGTVGLLLLGAVILAAYVYFNSRDLSRKDSYRDYVLRFCQVAGCSIAEYRDLNQIAVHRFLVRADLQQESQVRMDVLIENQARFDQRFPSIKVIFTDINGHTVEDKVFRPRDYLTGELQGAVAIPAGQQIHLTLLMQDPGEAAINYNAELID